MTARLLGKLTKPYQRILQEELAAEGRTWLPAVDGSEMTLTQFFGLDVFEIVFRGSGLGVRPNGKPRGEVTEVELEERRGNTFYEVEITAEDGTEMEMKISAESGEVLKVKADDEDCRKDRHQNDDDDDGEDA